MHGCTEEERWRSKGTKESFESYPGGIRKLMLKSESLYGNGMYYPKCFVQLI